MKAKYKKPNLELIKFDITDTVLTSGVTNIDTSAYGFTNSATHTNQGQQWLDIWNNK